MRREGTNVFVLLFWRHARCPSVYSVPPRFFLPRRHARLTGRARRAGFNKMRSSILRRRSCGAWIDRVQTISLGMYLSRPFLVYSVWLGRSYFPVFVVKAFRPFHKWCISPIPFRVQRIDWFDRHLASGKYIFSPRRKKTTFTSAATFYRSDLDEDFSLILSCVFYFITKFVPELFLERI